MRPFLFLFYVKLCRCAITCETLVNYTMFAMRNAGKKYVKEILSKMVINPETKQFKEPISDLSRVFTLGEFKAIQVLREQVRDQMYFDENGQPIREKLDTLIKDIDLGLWDSYLMWNYEAYQSVMMQIRMGQAIAGAAQRTVVNEVDTKTEEKKE